MPSSLRYSVSDCRIIPLDQVSDARGNLTFIEGGKHVPFEIKRIYYIYDVHTGSQRAGHAHRSLFQLLIATSGSFNVHLDDGTNTKSLSLSRPYEGLLITPMIWRTIDSFSSGSVCLSLASAHYDEGDYYRQYDDFIKAITISCSR